MADKLFVLILLASLGSQAIVAGFDIKDMFQKRIQELSIKTQEKK